jgi:DNA polymerase (family 10)
MPVHNAEIAEIFNMVADLLEIQGANPFRVRAYRNAARTVSDQGQSMAEKVERGEDLTRLAGIGKDLAAKITEIVRTGRLALLEDLQKETSPDISKLLKIPGLGPKRVKALYHELGIRNVEELRAAAQAGKVEKLEGFGRKTEQKILAEIEQVEQRSGRTSLAAAQEIAETLVGCLREFDGVKEAIAAGSYRRRQETVGDLDILVTCRQDSEVMERFVGHDDVDRVVSKGKTRATVLLRSGFQVDLRVVPQVSYGAALHYFTGSKAHNIAIRKLGLQQNLKINEYGVFKGDKRVAGKTEEEVYAMVGLRFIEPELREDRGEIEAAREGHLPHLVSLADLRGDLHVHTRETDGRNTLEEMAYAARERGYEYLAITDHTRRLTMAHGLDPKRLARQIREIDRVNARLNGFLLLKSAEVDILEDGSLDLPDEILKELDLTVCAVHYKFNLSERQQTERILRAMDNRYFTVLAHPSGRLIGRRNPYEVDMERIIQGARERGCFMEVNAQPERLDLNDIHCKAAKEHGVKVAISTDAHSTNELDMIRFGVGQARRGWLEADDVINTRSREGLRELLRR